MQGHIYLLLGASLGPDLLIPVYPYRPRRAARDTPYLAQRAPAASPSLRQRAPSAAPYRPRRASPGTGDQNV